MSDDKLHLPSHTLAHSRIISDKPIRQRNLVLLHNMLTRYRKLTIMETKAVTLTSN